MAETSARRVSMGVSVGVSYRNWDWSPCLMCSFTMLTAQALQVPCTSPQSHSDHKAANSKHLKNNSSAQSTHLNSSCPVTECREHGSCSRTTFSYDIIITASFMLLLTLACTSRYWGRKLGCITITAITTIFPILSIDNLYAMST